MGSTASVDAFTDACILQVKRHRVPQWNVPLRQWSVPLLQWTRSRMPVIYSANAFHCLSGRAHGRLYFTGQTPSGVSVERSTEAVERSTASVDALTDACNLQYKRIPLPQWNVPLRQWNVPPLQWTRSRMPVFYRSNALGCLSGTFH